METLQYLSTNLVKFFYLNSFIKENKMSQLIYKYIGCQHSDKVHPNIFKINRNYCTMFSSKSEE